MTVFNNSICRMNVPLLSMPSGYERKTRREKISGKHCQEFRTIQDAHKYQETIRFGIKLISNKIEHTPKCNLQWFKGFGKLS